MWNPNKDLPQEFADLLFEDEESGDDEEVYCDAIDDEQDRALADFADLPVYQDNGGGRFELLDGEGAPEIHGIMPLEPHHDVLQASSESEEEEFVRQRMLDKVSPLTIQASSSEESEDDPPPPRFAVRVEVEREDEREDEREVERDVEPPQRGMAARRGRGRGGRGGRGAIGGRGRRGRGRAVRGARGGERGHDWVRGEPLRERYATDEDIPEDVKMEIGRIQARRQRERERDDVRRERNDDVNGLGERDEIERFFDSRQEFNWESMESFDGQKEAFLPETSGPTREFPTAYSAFRAYWNDSILAHIVEETNVYAQTIQREAFQRSWYPTNADEILTLFAFWIMMGIIRMPTIKSCFTQLPILRTDVFRTLFIENRYWNLNAALHFARGPSDGTDPIHPIRPIVDHLNQKFKEVYNLHQDISIDESLTLWKGPFAHKQYIKSKAARFGVKTYQLCESSTGYLWNFYVYVGRAVRTTLSASNYSVITLIRPILNRGHVLFMDNFFNSPLLARFLKRNRTDCVGTLRPNRKDVPLAIQRVALREGEFIARHSGDVVTFSLEDRKRLTCISTYHDMAQVEIAAREGRPAQRKFKMIDDYNHSMGGIDKMDQMLEAYLVERKQCAKWSMKMFKRFLNISVQNSRILVEQSSNKKIDSLAYRLALVLAIKEQHLPHIPQQPVHRQRQNIPRPEARLTERHFVRRTPITAEMVANVVHRTSLGRRRCVWCNRNPPPGQRGQKTTMYECKSCLVPLCLEPCFEEYHTIP